jgi:hypothetical protein
MGTLNKAGNVNNIQVSRYAAKELNDFNQSSIIYRDLTNLAGCQCSQSQSYRTSGTATLLSLGSMQLNRKETESGLMMTIVTFSTERKVLGRYGAFSEHVKEC